MSYKHGEYIPLYWDSAAGDEPEYIKGHVTESEARAALEREASGRGEGSFSMRHIYGRWVFSQSDDYDRELRTYSDPQRGAFALTELRCVSTPPEVQR